MSILSLSRRRALLFAGAGVSSLALMPYARAQEVIGDAMPETVNVVYVKSPFNLQNMVMKQRRMLEEAFKPFGTTVRWHTITSGAKQAQAMAAGAIDVSAVMNTTSLLLANAAGNRIVVASGVSHPVDTFAIVVRSDAIESVKDLVGKKIAGPRGTVLHQTLAAALHEAGLGLKDVEFLSMDQAAALAALMTGNVDGALLAASGIIKAERAGARVLRTASGLVKVNLVLTSSEVFARKYPKALELIVDTERKALAWIRANPNAAVELGAKEHGISVDEARRLAEWSNYYDVLTENDLKGLEEDQTFLVENGMMDRHIDVRSLILPSAMR